MDLISLYLVFALLNFDDLAMRFISLLLHSQCELTNDQCFIALV